MKRVETRSNWSETMNRDDNHGESGRTSSRMDEQSERRRPYDTPDVDSVVPAMVPALLGTDVCGAPDGTNSPDCDNL